MRSSGRWSELRDPEKVAARIQIAARSNHWNDAQLLYNREWRHAVRCVPRGDRDAIEAALVFLEADPICVWSGFEQEDLFLMLAKLDLCESVQERLRVVVLRRLRTRPGRSRTLLKAIGHISAAIATPAFEAEILSLPRSADPVLWQHEQQFLRRLGLEKMVASSGIRAP